MGSRIDITGMVFSRLTVKEISSERPGSWLCVCECGNETIARRCDLLGGFKKSCGCLYKERRTRPLSHGGWNTPEYWAWAAMLSRCRNENNPGYKDYGGRGILVCERWEKFENFIADMGKRLSPKHTLERKDVNGNYCPENCEWATIRVQNRNRRVNHFVTLNNQTKCVTDWAEYFGVKPTTVFSRLRLGWPVDEKIFSPRNFNYKTSDAL